MRRGFGERGWGLLLALMVAVSGLLTPHQARAQSEDDDPPTSSEGALFLLLPVGAKAVSLGRAVTALPGAESAFWNPAGLAGVERSQVTVVRGDQAAGTATAVSVALARPGVGTLGASYFLLDAGDQDFVDRDGNVLGTISVRNHLGVLSGAARFLGRLDAGLNVKIVQFRYSCRGLCPDAGTTATTYAVDAGLQLEPSEAVPLRFGAMVAHVGPELQVLNAEQSDPLPARVRVAAAWDVLAAFTESSQLGAWLAVEVEDRLRDPGSPALYLGSELSAGEDDALLLRAGYVVGEQDQLDGARVGLGLRYERFELAIAKSLAVSTVNAGETEPVHVSFSIGF